MSKIAHFEALVERLVEGTFARLFAGQLSPLEVATHLARAMEDHQVVSPDGAPQAPTHYWVYLHPGDCDALAVARPTLEKELAHHVADLAAQADLEIPISPVIHVLPNAGIAVHQVRVEARWLPQESQPVEKTREITIESDLAKANEKAKNIASRPFLILDGQRHVNLLKATLSIGRALDNDIIIEDPRVSRHHAQLRRRYGRYVLYDLKSSGGTQINGYLIEECVLHAGDVISFAGVLVVYSEDPPTPIPGAEDTPALPTEIEFD